MQTQPVAPPAADQTDPNLLAYQLGAAQRLVKFAREECPDPKIQAALAACLNPVDRALLASAQ